MDFLSFSLFLATVALVAFAPGPSTLLVLSNAVSGDVRRPVALILGAALGNILLVTVTVLGVSTLVLASQTAFEVLRWIGAGYLIYLGIAYWRAPARLLTAAAAGRGTYSVLALQAFLTSVTNPKGLVFYFAFLPQFLSPVFAAGPQLAVLGGCYIVMFVLALSTYALAGRRIASLFSTARAMKWKNRMTGGLLIGSGLLLLRYERS